MDIFTILKTFKAAHLITKTDDFSNLFEYYCQKLMDDCKVKITYNGYTDDLNSDLFSIGGCTVVDDIVDMFLAYNLESDIDSFMRFVNDYIEYIYDYQLPALFNKFYPTHFGNDEFSDFYDKCMEDPDIQELKNKIDDKKDIEPQKNLYDDKKQTIELESRIIALEQNLNNIIIENNQFKLEILKRLEPVKSNLENDFDKK